MEKALYQRFTCALNRFSERTAEAVVTFAAIVIGLMMFITATDVVLRYGFNSPLAWSYELTRFFLLITVFFGLAFVGIKRSHVRITSVTSRLPQRSQIIIELITTLVGLILFCFITWQGVVGAMKLFEVKQIFSNLRWPVYTAWVMLSIGSFTFCIELLREFLDSLGKVFQEVGQKAWLWLGLAVVISMVLCLSPFWYPSSGLELSSTQWSIVGIILFLILLFSGMPIAFCMALVGFIGVGCLIGSSAGLNLLKTTPAATSMNYSFSVVPLFVLMGEFAYRAGIIKDLYDSMKSWFGRLPGGLAISTIGACAGFAAVSGSSVASGAAMTSICYPELRRHKYDKGLSTGCIAAGGTLGIMIPPSLDFIVYGLLTMTSIGALFIAGILPGLLMAFFFMITSYVLCRRNPKLGPLGPKTSLREKVAALKSVWPIMTLFLVIIGGIYLGVFTPTEAGGIGAFGAFLVLLSKRRFTWGTFFNSLKGTIETSAMILIILTGAMVLGYFLTLTNIPMKLASALAAWQVNRWVIMVVVMLVYIALGCIMDSFANMIVTVPIIFPAIMSLGFDPIWFGVIMIITVELGLITPPVGMLAFIISGVTKEVSIGEVFRGVLPFLLVDFVAVALIMFFPQISLFLPSLIK